MEGFVTINNFDNYIINNEGVIYRTDMLVDEKPMKIIPITYRTNNKLRVKLVRVVIQADKSIKIKHEGKYIDDLIREHFRVRNVAYNISESVCPSVCLNTLII